MSGHTQHKVPGEIVTSDAVHGRGGRSRLPLVVVILAVAVITAACLLVYWWRRSDMGNNPPAATTVQSQASLNPAQRELSAAVDDASTQLQNAKNSMDKAEAYKNLGAAYFNQGKYDDSIAAYNNAIKADSGIKPEVLDTLAYVYVTAGQRAKAIAVYQELIASIQQQSNDGHEAMIYEGGNTVQVYQHDIQVLQQGGTL